MMCKHSVISLMPICFVLTFAQAEELIIYYVDSEALQGGDGSSWETAFNNIQEAVDSDNEFVWHDVWVKSGEYILDETIAPQVPFRFYGGFSGNETNKDQRDWENNITIINGQNSFRCFQMGSYGGVIEGFVITHCYASYLGGGAIRYNPGLTLTVENCRFIENRAEDGGGAILARNTNLEVINCTFIRNSAGKGGGAVYAYVTGPDIINCSFIENHSGSDGGAINGGAGGGIGKITNGIFIGNTANNDGGAIFASYSREPFANCIFSENHAGNNGGAIKLDEVGKPPIINCTFYGNEADNTGGAIYKNDPFGDYVSLTNNIFWEDAPDEIHCEPPDECVVTYSDIQGGYPGIGNINSYPLFKNPQENDFHLKIGSPCIDVGTGEAEISEYDFEGDPRVFGSAPDMGADELFYLIVQIDIKPGCDKNPINLNSKGVIPVAILGNETFDVTEIDTSTLRFGPLETMPAHELTYAFNFEKHLEDINADGYIDLITHFRIQKTGISCADTSAKLYGETEEGVLFEGSDLIDIKHCR